MKRIFKCIALLLCLSLLSGCSSGIYSDFREINELMIVQTMGFDASPKGYSVSVSTGGGASEGAKITRMAADADSITKAEQEMQDYSAAEEIFYEHVNYIVMGGETAKSDLTHCLDYIRRSPQMRPDTPLFVVTNDTASRLVLGSGKDDYDATNVLKSLERNLDRRGDCLIFSARDVISSIDRNGSALICAVKTVEAKESLYDAEDELTALPAGYAVIKDGKMLGQISYSDALAVSLIQNKTGPCRMTVKADDEVSSVQLENCECKLEPVMNGEKLGGLRFDLKISASLPEFGGNLDMEKANTALANEIKARLTRVLDMEKLTSCDFLQLGGILETHHPVSLSGMGYDLRSYLPDIYYIINVDAQINRSFDTDMTEDKL